jgi:hypothetical protein
VALQRTAPLPVCALSPWVRPLEHEVLARSSALRPQTTDPNPAGRPDTNRSHHKENRCSFAQEWSEDGD